MRDFPKGAINCTKSKVNFTMELWLHQRVWPQLKAAIAMETDEPEDGGEDLLPEAWERFLALTPFNHHKLRVLMQRVLDLRASTVIYPDQAEIMSWAFFCDPADIRVIILGQDPYHGAQQATGLAFSVNTCVPVPPSLRNIYRELVRTYPDFKTPPHGCLTQWAERGVLLLNTILTVEAGKPGSHSKLGWQWFTNYIISCISESLDNCVFMLWGSKAIEKAQAIDSRRHLILKAQHPSPLASANQRSVYPPFLGCGHFAAANEYLINKGKSPIDWSLD